MNAKETLTKSTIVICSVRITPSPNPIRNFAAGPYLANLEQTDGVIT